MGVYLGSWEVSDWPLLLLRLLLLKVGVGKNLVVVHLDWIAGVGHLHGLWVWWSSIVDVLMVLLGRVALIH